MASLSIQLIGNSRVLTDCKKPPKRRFPVMAFGTDGVNAYGSRIIGSDGDCMHMAKSFNSHRSAHGLEKEGYCFGVTICGEDNFLLGLIKSGRRYVLVQRRSLRFAAAHTWWLVDEKVKLSDLLEALAESDFWDIKRTKVAEWTGSDIL